MGKPTICIGENKGAGQLISAFVFATLIVQFLFYLNLKFQASSSFLCLYSLVFVRPVRKPHCWFSHEMVHLSKYNGSVYSVSAQLFGSPPPQQANQAPPVLQPQTSINRTPTNTPTPTPPPQILSPPVIPVVTAARKTPTVQESSTVHHLAQTPHHANVATYIQGQGMFPRPFNSFKPGVPFMGHRQTE